MHIVKTLLTAVSIWFFSFAYAASFPDRPMAFINDFAKQMSEEEISVLNTKLSQFRDKSQVSIVVATISSASDYGYPTGLIDLGVRLFEKWKIGKAGMDSGVLIVIAGISPPYKIRITTGRGIEGPLPDIITKWIIEEKMQPAMHSRTSGAFARGIDLGVENIMMRTQHEFAKNENALGNVHQSTVVVVAIAILAPLSILIWLLLYYQKVQRGTKEALSEEAKEEAESHRMARFRTHSEPRTTSVYRVEPTPSGYRPRQQRRSVGSERKSNPPLVWVPREDDEGSGRKSASSSSFSDSTSYSPSQPDTGGTTAGGGGGDN